MTPRTGRRGSQSDGGALEEPLLRPGFASSPPARRHDDDDDDEDDSERGSETAPAAKRPKPPPSFARLLALARDDAGWLALGLASLLARLPFSLAAPHFISRAIGACIDADAKALRVALELFAIAGGVNAALDFWNVFLFALAQNRVVRRLRATLFDVVLAQPIAFFDENSSGSIVSRLTSDTTEIASNLSWVFRNVTEAVVRVLGIATYLLIQNPRLGAVACAVIPATTAANQLYGRWMARNASATQDALAAANATALEAIASVRTVRSFACEAFESRRYDGALGAWYELCNAQAAATGIYFSVMYSFLSQLCVPIALLGYGGALVMRSEMRADTLIAFMLYQGQLQEYVGNLLNACTSMYKSSGAAAAVFDIIDKGKNPPAAANDATHASGDEDASLSGSIPRFQGRVEFDSVTFAYPARPTKVVLNGFRLVARPGARVALVGASGAGKSTVFHLLQRFYDPDDGRVLLDGVDVRTLNHGWLHKVVALVGQEPVLFAGSVLDNITYSRRAGEWNTLHDAKREKEKRRRRARRRGYAEVDDEERNNGGRGDSNDDDDDDDEEEKQMERVVDADVVAAATAGNAAEFIDQLPRGYHTRCGERGVALSGGQKQRIAIARAILMNPSVLLLDEATSALDRASERGVLRAMDAASAGRTTLIIAHRTSTVMDADAICVLRGGVVVEEGTHAALMSRRGTPPAGSYADLSSSRGGGDDDATPP